MLFWPYFELNHLAYLPTDLDETKTTWKLISKGNFVGNDFCSIANFSIFSKYFSKKCKKYFGKQYLTYQILRYLKNSSRQSLVLKCSIFSYKYQQNRSICNWVESFFVLKNQSFEKTARKVLACIFCDKIKTNASKYLKISMDIPIHSINKLWNFHKDWLNIFLSVLVWSFQIYDSSRKSQIRNIVFPIYVHRELDIS